METLITNLYCFLELWMIQIYAGMIWGQRICFKGFSCILFIVNGIVFTGISRGIFPGFLSIFIHIFLFIYLWIKLKLSFKENIVKFCILFIIAWITEILSGSIVYYFGNYLTNEGWKLVVINAVSVSIAFLITYDIKKKKRTGDMKIEYRAWWKIILVCIIPIGILVFAYAETRSLKLWYNIFIAVFCSILLCYFIKIQKSKVEIEKKELEININKIYGDLYKNDIDDIRKRQHDYKNQLAAVYSSHKTAKSLSELIELQRKYCDMLQEESEYEYILTACEEPVLAGFLHYKCVCCKSRGVEVDADIHVGKWAGSIMLYELIELVGILIDNAFEQEIENNFNAKKIYFTFVERADRFYVCTENRLKDGLKAELSKMFEPGYSTKGEKRGLGLARAKQICDRYGQEIKIILKNEEEKRIKLELEIRK